MALNFTSVKKEGHYFIFTAEERKNPIKFDCINGTFITTRKVYPTWTMPENMTREWYADSTPHIYGGNDRNFARSFVYTLFCGFARFCSTENKRRLISILETIYANKDLLPDGNESFRVDLREELKEFPRGFFSWLRKENRFITKDNLLLFAYKDYLKNAKISALIKDITEQDDLDRINGVDFETLSTLAQVHAVFKKEFSWNARADFCEFYRLVFSYHKERLLPTLNDWIDKNRGYGYNNKLAEAFLDKERNEKIIKNENKIRDIEKLETENLCIKVPSTIEDFTEEGRMQNNCVGSYYHDSIANGENLIYFIRKKENKNHSYITCRFRMGSYETIEFRVVNNDSVTDEEALAFIKLIDEKISGLLKGRG